MNSHEITEIIGHWSSSFSEDTPNSICALYNEKASLWGTLSPLKRDNAGLIKDYFDKIFNYQNRRVAINDSSIRFFGDIAICNGQYTFSWSKEGIDETTVARFSFVYIKKCDRWSIIEHHSSLIPIAA